jgi:hypothetical protein
MFRLHTVLTYVTRLLRWQTLVTTGFHEVLGRKMSKSGISVRLHKFLLLLDIQKLYLVWRITVRCTNGCLTF